ncbi:class I SAM-dependent methyltransferase [Terasakiella sp. SH-1]|uniref:class I SAM-dependent methyltransferase n=1 Tax=Terasakiella sp. SH-1 TaxID=2560057 RepID=UPI0010736F58|nr:class I SAM-dependent methyltransferase [Terasakiella sp. SH-1]
MKIGKLDTHSESLKNRVDLQKKLSSFDLNEWIFQYLSPYAGATCLDLGCGRGNQTLEIAKTIGENGHITSIDLSKESLQALEKSAREQETLTRIHTINSELDNIDKYLENKKFDRVVGSYSLYYVRNAEHMFKTIHQHLNDGGRFFYCGPSHENNIELRNIIASVTQDKNVLEPTVASKFMEMESQIIVKSLFKNVELFTFKNEVTFPCIESINTYWKSHNLYNKEFDDKFQRLVAEYFDRNGQFINVKRGIGVLAIK